MSVGCDHLRAQLVGSVFTDTCVYYAVRCRVGRQNTKTTMAGRLVSHDTLSKLCPVTQGSCNTNQYSTWCVVGADRRPQRQPGPIRRPRNSTAHSPLALRSFLDRFRQLPDNPVGGCTQSCTAPIKAAQPQPVWAPPVNHHTLALASAWTIDNRPLQSQSACPHSTGAREHASCNHRLFAGPCIVYRRRGLAMFGFSCISSV